MSALAGTPAVRPDAPSCTAVSFALGALELDGQGVLEVPAPPALAPVLPAWRRWRGRQVPRAAGRGRWPARGPLLGRRLGRRLGPCLVPLSALAAIEATQVVAPRVWLRAVGAAAADLRADSRITLGIITAVLANRAGVTSTSAPTWKTLAAIAERSARTVARWIAWLRERGLLVSVEHGSTQQFRPRSMALEGNRAAVYLLTARLPAPAAVLAGQDQPVTDAPPVSVTLRDVTPSTLPLLKRGRGSSRGRTSAPPRSDERPEAASPPWGAAGKDAEDQEEPRQQRQGRYRRTDRGSRGDQRASDLASAAALRRSALDLRAISDAAVRSVIRPLTAIGWEVADLIHAIDHKPDGTRRLYASAPAAPSFEHDPAHGGHQRPPWAVTSPTAWLRWRLSAWQGLPGPAAARRAATVAGQRDEALRAAARRAAADAAEAARTSAPAGFAAARAALRASARPSAAQRSLTPWMPSDLDTSST